MFQSAIEKIAGFTKPVKTITRTFEGLIQPGSATFFFVNNHGIAVTCKHVAAMITDAEKINENYNHFKQERNAIPKNNHYKNYVNNLSKKYGYRSETTIQMKHNFPDCFDRLDAITCHYHPTLDLAVVEFKGFQKLFYESHAIFLKDDKNIKQGQYLCRYGFPFPEFSNFEYKEVIDDIEFTNQGNPSCPSFPIDGIITRFVNDGTGNIFGIEMSTPGLRGQSGGPLFDTTGIIYGMQFATNHLYLGFDIEKKEITSNGRKSIVSNHPFFHTGICIHVKEIKDFLRSLQIDFTEE